MTLITINTPTLPERPTVVTVTYDDLAGAAKGPDFLDTCEAIAARKHDGENAGHDRLAQYIDEHEGAIIDAAAPDIDFWQREKMRTSGIVYERPRNGDSSLGLNRLELMAWFYGGVLALLGGYITLLIFGIYVQDSGFLDAASVDLWRALLIATPVLFAGAVIAQGIERIGNVNDAKRACGRLLKVASVLLVVFVVVSAFAVQSSTTELGGGDSGGLPLPDTATGAPVASAWIGDVLLGVPWGKAVMMATAILVEVLFVALLKVHFVMKGWAGRAAIPFSAQDGDLAEEKIAEIRARLVENHTRRAAAQTFRQDNAAMRAERVQEARLLGQRILNEHQARRDRALAQADAEIFDLDAYRRPTVTAAG